ncbi:hypothetical protein E3P99_00283 [Wallemia hederae]|uniref:Peroxisome assembly protein 12 n=1 Tax=Wallemia hederae TaxID=1540922 RepID=A0A4T0FXE1_9BASI|nr:hypothetical protein E3P99_00283 [Wallemia hederae]
MDIQLESSSFTDKPSLFELFAQDELTDLLQPAVKYLLSILATRYPRYLIRLVNHHEEFYALVMLVVESHYLRSQNASFTESFYGLKRRNRPAFELTQSAPFLDKHHQSFDKLTRGQIYGSLAFQVGVPYLRAKSKELYDIWGGNEPSELFRDQEQSEREQSYKTLFKKVYPYANLALEATFLSYNLRYMFNSTPFYRPWLQWLNVDIRRQTLSDVLQASKSAQHKSLLRKIPSLLLSSLKTALPVTLFILKFLQWWYSNQSPRLQREEAKKANKTRMPPPAKLTKHPESTVPDDKLKFGLDPLSGDPLENPTLLPTGYVYSFKSVFDYVDKHHCCPVTLKPVKITQLRKVLL